MPSWRRRSSPRARYEVRLRGGGEQPRVSENETVSSFVHVRQPASVRCAGGG